MITFENVSKLYGENPAVDDLSLSVEEGEFTVLIGPSGCGKSTTLRMINRLVEVTSGTIAVDGTDVGSYRPEELRRSMGYVIQSVGLFPHMDVAQNISVVPKLLGWEPSRIEARVDELLELFSLDHFEYRAKYPRQLSGGEAQRVGVARALAADPAILLMDEPFGALDPITRESLQTEFARIQRELRKTIVFVTHDIDEAIRLATRIVILKDGKLVQQDTPEQILAKPVDGFVQEFIGADRALKRLSRLTVRGYVRKPVTVRSRASLSEARKIAAGNRYCWVVGDCEFLTGWIDLAVEAEGDATVEGAMTHVDPKMVGVTVESSLKETLSKMVQAGLRTSPVLGDDGGLVGEVHLIEILEA